MPWWGWVLVSWPAASLGSIVLLVALARSDPDKELRERLASSGVRHTVRVAVQPSRARAASTRRLAS